MHSACFYQSARIGGADIHYHLADYTDPWRATPAETFLLYPGYCRNLEFWRAWVPLLARDYRVLRLDPRGYGHSSKPPVGTELDAEEAVRDALGLLDHLGITRVHWVGESTGGRIGMLAALLAPQRIASIAACNTTARTSAQTVDLYALGERDQAAAIEKFGVGEWCRRTLQYRVDVTKIPAGLGEWWAREMDRVPRHVAASAFRRFTVVDVGPRLGEISAPVLLMVGDNCPAPRKQRIEEMSREFPRGQLVNLEGYDFGIHVLAPERCVAAVRQFVADQR
jgi:pimeloyl-ACP methyl ester carboxylesterase